MGDKLFLVLRKIGIFGHAHISPLKAPRAKLFTHVWQKHNLSITTCAGAPLPHVGHLDLGALDALDVLQDVPHRFALHRVDLKNDKNKEMVVKVILRIQLKELFIIYLLSVLKPFLCFMTKCFAQRQAARYLFFKENRTYSLRKGHFNERIETKKAQLSAGPELKPSQKQGGT